MDMDCALSIGRPLSMEQMPRKRKEKIVSLAWPRSENGMGCVVPPPSACQSKISASMDKTPSRLLFEPYHPGFAAVSRRALL